MATGKRNKSGPGFGQKFLLLPVHTSAVHSLSMCCGNRPWVEGGNLDYGRQKDRLLKDLTRPRDAQELPHGQGFRHGNGISLTPGLMTPGVLEAYIRRAMADAAREVFVVVDHSKFNVVSATKIL